MSLLGNPLIVGTAGLTAGVIWHEQIRSTFGNAVKAVKGQGKIDHSQQQQQPLADISTPPQDTVDIKQKGSPAENTGDTAAPSQQGASGPSLTSPVESTADTVDALLNASNTTGSKSSTASSGSV